MIIIIMNMQNKIHTIQSSHHPTTDLQPVPEQRSRNLEFPNFPRKFELLDKKGFKHPENPNADSLLPPGQGLLHTCSVAEYEERGKSP